MKTLSNFFDKDRQVYLLLFSVSFCIYFFYFHAAFLNLNTILCDISGDALKNYYTYVYHIKNDTAVLHFSGMNYPFGEHIVYTDCQPLLTFILRLLPFTHNYLTGILNGLIFFSFMITPVILYKIFSRLDLPRFTGFFASLAITLLSPQFLKIHGGHFALTYAFVIPLSVLLTLNLIKERKVGALLKLTVYNTVLFLMHPYFGFSVSVFCFISLLILELRPFNKITFLKNLSQAVIGGLVPILLFKIFMLLTDHHPGRTEEPYGLELFTSGVAGLLIPSMSPFKTFLKQVFRLAPSHYEGFCYLGIFFILFFFIFIAALPFIIRKLSWGKEAAALFISSIILLLLSFGLHNPVLDALDLKLPALNQFRALGRFSWFFYYMLPLFLFPVFFHTLTKYFSLKIVHRLFGAAAVFYFVFNLFEAGAVFKFDSTEFWKSRNIFNTDCLNKEEKNLISIFRSAKAEAILPLPLFHEGSEVYDRFGNINSRLPALIYSFHAGLPLISSQLSRTSIPETEGLIELLNPYKKNRRAALLLNGGPFVVINTNDKLLHDEEQVKIKTRFFQNNDTLAFGYISKKDLLTRTNGKTNFRLWSDKTKEADSNNVVFIPTEQRKPFITSNMNVYETIYSLDSNRIKSDNYIVSFHYYYSQKIFRAVSCNFIVTRTNASGSEWISTPAIRQFSGFYGGFAVFEYYIQLQKENKYEFAIRGSEDQTYKISDFMLRPENKTVMGISAGRDTVYNNFPD